MTLLQSMQEAKDALFDVEEYLRDPAVCITMVPWRRIEDIVPFYAKVIYDYQEECHFTVIATRDIEYDIRNVFKGIDFYNQYENIEIYKDDDTRLEDFLSSIDNDDITAMAMSKMGVDINDY